MSNTHTQYGSGECYFDFYESSEEETDDEGEKENSEFTYHHHHHHQRHHHAQQSGAMSSSHFSSLSQLDASDIYGVIPLSRLEIDFVKKESRVSKALKNCRKFIVDYFMCRKLFSNELKRCRQQEEVDSVIESEQQIPSTSMSTSDNNTQQNTPRIHQCIQQCDEGSRSVNRASSQRGRRTFNSVSKIDKFSRVVFPLFYLAINLIYWVFYLSRSQRK